MKERKKIGKRENKENREKKKKERKKKEFSRQAKSVDVQTSVCHRSWDSQEARTVLLQYQNFVGFMLNLHCN